MGQRFNVDEIQFSIISIHSKELMIRNLFFSLIGLFGGLWLVWPGISSSKGWECASDIVMNAEKEPTDSISLLESIQRKLKLSSAVSTKTLLKADNLGAMEKFRIVGDACFRF